MKLKFILILLTPLFLISELNAQYSIISGKKELFPMNGTYKYSGWFWGPGLTYQLTRFNNPEDTLFQSTLGDSLLLGEVDPSGRIGLYIEVGRFHVLSNTGLINYLDYGVSFKQIRGKQKTSSTLLSMPSESILVQNETEGKFGDGYLSAFFNLNSVKQLGNYSFIQNSLGLNIDYRLYGNRKFEGDSLGHKFEYAPDLLAQLHYKLGIGFKIHGELFLIPSIETPILNLYKWDDGKSTLNFFDSRYRNITLTLRFALPRENKDACPTVDGNPGDKKRSQEYQQRK